MKCRVASWGVAIAVTGSMMACSSSGPAPKPGLAGAPPALHRPVQPDEPDIAWMLPPARIRSSCQAAIAHARARVAVVTAREVREGAHELTQLRAIETAVAELQEALIAQRLLASVTDDGAVRQASARCREAFAALQVEFASDPAIYALARGAHSKAVEPADIQLAKLYVENGRRTGASLDPDTRATVQALFDQLGKLERAYMQAIGTPPTTIAISPAEAASLPPAFVRTLTASDAGYLVPVHYGTRERFLTNQASGAARQRYLTAFLNRGGSANVKRLEQALALRHQIAQHLGFASWAAYKLDTRMAKSPARALRLLEDVAARLLPRARQEIMRLSRMKAAAGDQTPFAAWDYPYYLEKLYRARFGVDAEMVRQYFPVDHFVPAVLALYANLLGVRYQPLATAAAWHPEVRAYAVIDSASNQLLGWFFLDLIPRSGKSLHFSHFPLRAGRALPGGGYRRPIAAIIGNGPPPEPGHTQLLSHNDAIIFFHEFGHLMHDTLSRARYATLFGSNVRRDFAEAPSQMFENWMWQPSILAKVSSHVTTGAPLPDQLIAQMVARKRVDTGAFWTRQAFFGIYDLTIHKHGPTVATSALWLELATRLTALPQPSGTHPQSSFAGFMGGYDAGYYGYLWAKIFAQDMFTAFRNAGLEHPAVGQRYRRTILEPGGTREPDQLLEDFLGRPVQADAFYEALGIDTEI